MTNLSNLMNKPYQRLKTARIAKGYANAKTFTDKFTISYSTYAAHEAGRINLSEKSAKKYAQLLAVPKDWLLYGDINETDIDSDYNNTTSIHLRNNALEPRLMPTVLIAVLKILKKYDDTINYKELISECNIIVKEILAKGNNLNIEQIDPLVATIVALSKDSLAKKIINV